MTLYTSTELSNEDYHALPEVSGSTLAAIYNDCPAAWRYGEKVQTKAMEEGTAAHALLLEPNVFDKYYIREPSPEEMTGKTVLVTAKDIAAWMKERGIKGGSGKTKQELIEMVSDEVSRDESTIIWDSYITELKASNVGKAFLNGAAFDRLHLMRATIFNDAEYTEALTGASVELSSVLPDHDVKARWDIVTKKGEIWDYKSTTSAHPDSFGRQAHDLGYWLKMAFQHDVYRLEFGEAPRRVVLLAQSKKAPFIPKAYELTPEQLHVGRTQYKEALTQYRKAKDSGRWPAYGSGVSPLATPEYLAKRYGFNS